MWSSCFRLGVRLCGLAHSPQAGNRGGSSSTGVPFRVKLVANPARGERHGTRTHSSMACQPAWPSCLASPLPRVLPGTHGGIVPRTLGRHRGGMSKERLGETDTDIVRGKQTAEPERIETRMRAAL